MKLLIITQKIDKNDDILGFFHRWVQEFAKHCEKVTVICLQKGEYDLSDNVKVLSLGKEKNTLINPGVIPRILLKLKYAFNFYKYIWQERKNYDAVFAHMNPEYIVLGGFFWKLFGKKTSLWYTHRQVNLKLKIAEKLVDNIFTASKESFQLKSKKVGFLGHGIDIKQYKCEKRTKTENKSSENLKIKILHVGRITPIKNCDILIKTAKILKDKWNKDFHIQFLGSPVTLKDKQYFKLLKKMTVSMGLSDEIDFLGSVPNNKIKEFYCSADFAVNLAPTGGVDKVVLESMASKTLVFASNLAFFDYFGQYSKDLMFKERDSEDLTEKIMRLEKSKNKDSIKDFLFTKINNTASLNKLVKNILSKI